MCWNKRSKNFGCKKKNGMYLYIDRVIFHNITILCYLQHFSFQMKEKINYYYSIKITPPTLNYQQILRHLTCNACLL